MIRLEALWYSSIDMNYKYKLNLFQIISFFVLEKKNLHLFEKLLIKSKILKYIVMSK